MALVGTGRTVGSDVVGLEATGLKRGDLDGLIGENLKNSHGTHSYSNTTFVLLFLLFSLNNYPHNYNEVILILLPVRVGDITMRSPVKELITNIVDVVFVLQLSCSYTYT